MTMITTSQAVAFAPQAGNAPGTDAVSKLRAVTDASYRWLPTVDISLATSQDQKSLPQEMSGSLLPRAVYKGGAFVGGTVSIIPRTDGSHLHWLLYSLTSSWNHVADGEKHKHYYGVGDDQIAPFDPTSEATKAATGGGANDTDYFLSAKRLFPRPDANASIATRSGETYEDLRVSAMELTFAPSTYVSAKFGLLGRKSSFVADTSAGASTYWKPSYVDLATGFPGLQRNDTFALGCRGELNMPVSGQSMNLSATGATIGIAAMLTKPQDESILFSFHPETFKILARGVTITINVKRNILSMYQNIFNNGGADWSPVVWNNGAPISIIAKTQDDLAFGTAGNEFPGLIEFWARDVKWTMTPIVGKAGQILGGQITGTVVEPDNGGTAWYLMIQNDRDPDKDESGAASVGFLNWPTT